MPVEFIRTATMDGLLLEGAFTPSVGHLMLPIDACLFLHGTGDNFYSRGVLEACAGAAQADGLATLRVNTRGHDGICSLPGRRGSAFGGAAFEKISECNYDVSAWLDWLASRGLKRVALVGHSMGAVKAIYSQAHAPHAAVSAILAASPPRFQHTWFQQHAKGERFREDFAKAQELIARGQGESLIYVAQPLPYIASAASYVEKYGPEDKYDFVPLLARLKAPALLLVGELSEQSSPAFDQTLSAISKIQDKLPLVSAERVPGADIAYRGQLDAPWVRFAGWLKKNPPKPPSKSS